MYEKTITKLNELRNTKDIENNFNVSIKNMNTANDMAKLEETALANAKSAKERRELNDYVESFKYDDQEKNNIEAQEATELNNLYQTERAEFEKEYQSKVTRLNKAEDKVINTIMDKLISECKKLEPLVNELKQMEADEQYLFNSRGINHYAYGLTEFIKDATPISLVSREHLGFKNKELPTGYLHNYKTIGDVTYTRGEDERKTILEIVSNELVKEDK